jgi:GNAT superfamily N-acetyltransferase
MTGGNAMLRDYTDHDFAACAAIVNQVWAFDAKFSPPTLAELFTNIYTAMSLGASNTAFVIEEAGQIAGFLFGKCGQGRCYPAMYSGFCGELRMFWQFFSMKGLPLRKKFYYVNILIAHEINRRKVAPVRANEVHLFAVAAHTQGKGYGKMLMEAYIARCKALNVRRVTLDTDGECNYGFYEHFGFTLKGTFYSPLQREYSGKSGDSYVYELAF